ncbi:fatty acyl-AMP ligase [Actinoplanes sp. NPDC023801]|uniref:fatty acyl-AMP ligase n=1 Tax=Actinoplanes sp. NPDC023801 TaxID=3154595 RepID=UPI0033D2E5B0
MTDTITMPTSLDLDLTTMLARRAVLTPDTVAYAMIQPTGRLHDDELTYAGLDTAARARAATLLDLGLGGRSVVMLYPTGLEFPRALLGCQLAGVRGAPVKVPHRRSGLLRVRAVADDAGATTILTTTDVRRRLEEQFGDAEELAGLSWVCTDVIPDGVALAYYPQPVRADDIAMLQYTSGSTGSPKGVVVTHRNFCLNADDLAQRWPVGDGGRIVSWLPLFHDMGLLFGIVMPLWTGAPAYLMSPDDFARRPLRWFEAISRLRGTHTAAPNLAYELCSRAVADAPADLDLSSLRAAISGSEPVRWETVERLAAAFAPFGLARRAISPGYGLAENTLKVSGSRESDLPRTLWLSGPALADRKVVPVDPADQDATAVVSCGPADGLTEVTIVDPVTRTRGSDETVGEIWLSGPCAAQGYWGRPAETAETFGATLADGDPGRRYLRTGDLGFVQGGELFVAGRLKDVIIRFGRNYYPQDIEQTTELCAPGLQPSCSAAFAVEGDATEALVIVVEVNGRVLRDTPVRQLTDTVRETVKARHGIPVADVVLIRRGTLPRTTSGKVQRRACRAGYLDGTLSRIATAAAEPGEGDA